MLWLTSHWLNWANTARSYLKAMIMFFSIAAWIDSWQTCLVSVTKVPEASWCGIFSALSSISLVGWDYRHGAFLELRSAFVTQANILALDHDTFSESGLVKREGTSLDTRLRIADSSGGWVQRCFCSEDSFWFNWSKKRVFTGFSRCWGRSMQGLCVLGFSAFHSPRQFCMYPNTTTPTPSPLPPPLTHNTHRHARAPTNTHTHNTHTRACAHFFFT